MGKMGSETRGPSGFGPLYSYWGSRALSRSALTLIIFVQFSAYVKYYKRFRFYVLILTVPL